MVDYFQTRQIYCWAGFVRPLILPRDNADDIADPQCSIRCARAPFQLLAARLESLLFAPAIDKRLYYTHRSARAILLVLVPFLVIAWLFHLLTKQ